ncbi:competence protein ComEC [Microvirga sp. VF16]|uniref:competence protein ComEC n=1 Tax=Microvirga sp. VF16 TaxID=2807101 RepID=UPI00193D5547|nr:competence protein ComEC [Microvirga sp. VF16]QRM35454.1 competence protein ComEC [Microvirga sp. VF16]
MGFEIEFLPVGDSNGDAICIRYGDDEQGYWVHVVDGGFVDTGQTIIEHIEQHYYGPGTVIANVVLSHADNDHACGLIKVIEHFDVRNIWMNRPWLYADEVVDSFHGNYSVPGLIDKMRQMHPYLVEIEKIAARKKIPIHEAFQGSLIGPFRVMAPSRQRYVSLIPDLDKTPASYAETKGVFGYVAEVAKSVVQKVQEAWGIETLQDNPDPTSASNETSIVQLGAIDGETILLTADVGPAGLEEAARYAYSLGLLKSPNFVQVPHHGSRRNVTPKVLNWWLGRPLEQEGNIRGYAYVSVGKDADIYPRKRVKNAFIRRGYTVHATRGITKRYTRNMAARDGWIASTPEPFSVDVED